MTVLQESLARSLRTLFIACTVVVVLALGVAFGLPGGHIGRHGGSGEQGVMAEMTTIDAEHEPVLD